MNRKFVIGGVAVAFAVFVAAWLASPLLAFNNLRTALKAGDRDRVEQLVDFPAVREDLKAQMTARLTAAYQNDPEMKDNPFAGLAMMMAPAIVGQAVDALITPAGLTAVVETGDPRDALAPAEPETGSAAAKPKKERPEPVLGYKDLNTFTATIMPEDGGKTVMVMKRRGLFGWRLTRIELPADMAGPNPEG